jgi:tetratricopeptide (TPR) repeat protein
MRTIYLHIGTWKTGTTTIQNTLHLNRRTLLDHGLNYPDIGANHTFLASSFHERPLEHNIAKSRQLTEESLLEWHAISKQKFEASVTQVPTTMVSSEFLLGLSIGGLRDLKSYLEVFFDEIVVIAYLRNPIDHVTSAVNEQVKQGHYGIPEACQIHKKLNEYHKLENWINVFGLDSCVLKPFARDRFVKHDLLTDLLSVIFDENIPHLKILGKEANASLSFEALLIADSLIRVAPNFFDRPANSRLLRQISGSKYILPRDVQKAAIDSATPFLDKYNSRYKFDFKLEISNTDKVQNNKLWGQKTIDSFAMLLNDLMLSCSMTQPRDIKGLRLKAIEAVRSNNSAEAELLFEIAIEGSQDFKDYRDYSIFLQKKGDYQKAMDMCQVAVDLRPDRPWLKKLMQSIINDANG